MALSIVNEAFSNPGETSVTIFGVTIGNLVIVPLGIAGGPSNTITSVTDGSNTYTHVTNSEGISNNSSSPTRSDIWYSVVTIGGDLTITFNTVDGLPSTTIYIIRAIEVTGFNMSTPLINATTSHNPTVNTAAPLIGPNSTTTQAGDWVITVFQQSINPETLNSPFIEFDVNGNIPGGYYNPNAIGTYHATASGGGNDEFAASAAILVTAVASSSIVSTTMFLNIE